MKSAYLPLILAILGGVVYNVSQKSVPKDANPIFTVIIAYIAGILILTVFHLLSPQDKPFLATVKEINWSMITVGLGAVMIEIGILLAYRAGWNIGVTSTIMGASVSILLIPVAILVYKEYLSLWNMVGVLLCIVGLGLAAKK